MDGQEAQSGLAYVTTERTIKRYSWVSQLACALVHVIAGNILLRWR